MEESDSFINNGETEGDKSINTTRGNTDQKELVKHNQPF